MKVNIDNVLRAHQLAILEPKPPVRAPNKTPWHPFVGWAQFIVDEHGTGWKVTHYMDKNGKWITT